MEIVCSGIVIAFTNKEGAVNVRTIFCLVLLILFSGAFLGCVEKDSSQEEASSQTNLDADDDGLADSDDNCPGCKSTNFCNTDSDIDGLGDPCDPNDDGDALLDDADNCQWVPNSDQLDSNGDGIGDACDADGDGVMDPHPLCPGTENPEDQQCAN